MLVDGARARDKMMGEVFEHALLLTAGSNPGSSRRLLISEAKARVSELLGIEQGFDPQAIPGQEELPPAAVPDGKGEHAV